MAVRRDQISRQMGPVIAGTDAMKAEAAGSIRSE
jgi:hypothetical protein